MFQCQRNRYVLPDRIWVRCTRSAVVRLTGSCSRRHSNSYDVCKPCADLVSRDPGLCKACYDHDGSERSVALIKEALL